MAANAQFATPPPAINLPNLSVPPPTTPNLSAPPPTLTTINTSSGGFQHRYQNNRDGNRGFFKPFRPYHAPKIISGGGEVVDEFDGKRLRKSVMRKTVDYNSAIIKALEVRKSMILLVYFSFVYILLFVYFLLLFILYY